MSLSKNINPSLVLVQPRKTRPFITERLLMGRKESNQTNKQTNKITIILRKTIEGYYNSFDFNTFEKIIAKQSIFVFDRTINLQFSKVQNEMYGSLVTIQYHAKCNNPLYRKFKRNNFCFIFSAAKSTWSLLFFSHSDQRKVVTPIYQSLH